MRVRIRFEVDGYKWVVESKRWYNFGWKYEKGYFPFEPTKTNRQQATEYAINLLNTQIEEIK